LSTISDTHYPCDFLVVSSVVDRLSRELLFGDNVFKNNEWPSKKAEEIGENDLCVVFSDGAYLAQLELRR